MCVSAQVPSRGHLQYITFYLPVAYLQPYGVFGNSPKEPKCCIFMLFMPQDMERQQLNVFRMRLLGAEVCSAPIQWLFLQLVRTSSLAAGWNVKDAVSVQRDLSVVACQRRLCPEVSLQSRESSRHVLARSMRHADSAWRSRCGLWMRAPAR